MPPEAARGLGMFCYIWDGDMAILGVMVQIIIRVPAQILSIVGNIKANQNLFSAFMSLAGTAAASKT